MEGIGQPPPTPSSAASETTGSSVIGGGAWQLGSILLPQVTIVILSIAVARLLGPEDFGRQSFIAFAALSTVMLLSSGLSLGLTRYAAELLGRGETTSLPSLVEWTASVQLGGAVVGGVGLALVGALGAAPSAAWELAGLSTALAIMQTVPNSLLLGAQRFKQAGVIGLATNLVAVPSTIAVVALGGGIVGIFAVEAAVIAVNLGWTVLVARRTTRELVPDTRASARRWHAPLMRFAGLTTVETLVALVVWRRSEFFFLDAYSTDAEIGFYSIAFAAVSALSLIPQALATTLTPAFATLAGAGEWGRIRSGFGRTLRLLTLAMLPIVAGAVALGPGAIQLLYGEDYSKAGTVLLVMLVLLPLMPLYEGGTSLLAGLGLALTPMLLTAVAAAVNLGLDFIFIPRWDAIGAAAASTVAQGVVILPMTVYAFRVAGGVELHVSALLRATAACAAAGLVAFGVWEALGGAAGLLLGLVAGVAALAVLARLLRFVPAEDAAWLEDTVGSRLGGRVGRAVQFVSQRPIPSVSP